MKPRDNPGLQDWLGGFSDPAAHSADSFSWIWSDDTDGSHAASAVGIDVSFLSPDAESGGLQNETNDEVTALLQADSLAGDFSHHASDVAVGAAEGSSTPPPVVLLPATAPALPPVDAVSPLTGFVASAMPEAAGSLAGAIVTPAHVDYQIFITSPSAAAHDAAPVVVAPAIQASLTGPEEASLAPVTDASVGSHGATAAQVQAALDESGLNVNGTGTKVGVLSDSFNDLGGYAADQADGALPSVQVLADLSSGGTDEGRAMLQIVHDIAPDASLAFYTADSGEQAFANGILALAAAGCKVICDDVSYYDEPFFGGGVIAQAIQTVEAEGVTYITSAGNDASNAYQAAWTPISSASYDGISLFDVENFGGSIVKNITVTASASEPVPLLLEWNQPYGEATADLVLYVFQNGHYVGSETNRSDGESTNPWTGIELTASGTYQIVIDNLSSVPNSDPTLIKLIAAGDGLPVTISGANSGTVFGHALTPGVIAVGAVSTADTPAFGFSTPVSESFSSSGAGSELLYASNGTALSSPELINPVAVSSVDNIATTVSGGLGDFYGTSAASASLAGVAALILAANPSLTPAQVEQIMEETAVPMSNSAVSGAGLVNVDAAVAAAEALLRVTIESFGSTDLVQVGNDFYLDSNSTGNNNSSISTGTGPELINGGTPVTANQSPGWSLIGAEKTASGYEVAWENASTGQFNVWGTDNSGAVDANLSGGLVSGSSAALETLETSFHQDLNGDGTIGPVTTVIESLGSTDLVQVGNNFFLESNSTGTGPELMNGGTPVAANQSPGWSLIGAEQTASGYEVAWKNVNTGQFNVWGTDNSGAVDANLTGGLVSGTSAVLEALETSFHQDLNGDGTIGLITTVIESLGSTSLVQVGNNFYLDSNSTGTGPELINGGTPVLATQSPGWSLIGAEKTASGYEVAWENAGTGQFNVWGTDNSGVVDANLTGGLVSGSSAVLETLETSFHQDLNGDGTIGPITTVIESLGSTSLVQVGNNFYLDSNSTGTGPELINGGTPVLATQSPGWSLIGAEKTASGYEVAWENAGTGQFNVWGTDNSGVVDANLTGGIVSGTSAVLEALETSFHQDLNGDGTIGPITTVIESLGSTSLVQVGNNFYLDSNSTGTGPELINGGTPVLPTQSPGWSLIGAEKTASGYEVAWENAGTGQFNVWGTDNSGVVDANLTGGLVSGTSAVLEALETSFHQDLNGDGTIGVVSQSSSVISMVVAAASGSTVHDNFVFHPALGQQPPAPSGTIAPDEVAHFTNGNQAGGFWSYNHAANTQTSFQPAHDSQGETADADNHDLAHAVSAHHAEFMHAFLIH